MVGNWMCSKLLQRDMLTGNVFTFRSHAGSHCRLSVCLWVLMVSSCVSVSHKHVSSFFLLAWQGKHSVWGGKEHAECASQWQNWLSLAPLEVTLGGVYCQHGYRIYRKSWQTIICICLLCFSCKMSLKSVKEKVELKDLGVINWLKILIST